MQFWTYPSGGSSAATDNNPLQRMTILSTGLVGIGIATPQSLTHIHSGSLQITNSNTGSGSSGVGLLIGQASSGSSTVEINNQSSGDMKLMTGNNSKLCIDNGTGGYVAIGNGFTTPASRLHVRENTGSVDTWFQLTSNGTGHNSGDGLRIGVTDASPYDVEIKQQEGADLNFYTTALQRAVIKADGRVGINTDAPGFQLDVIANSSTYLGIGGYVSTSHTCAGCTNVAGTFEALNGDVNYAVKCTTSTGANTNVGGGFYATGAGSSVNHGAHGDAVGSSTSTNAGVYGSAVGTGSSTNYGVYGNASGGSLAYGVYGNGGTNCVGGGPCTTAAGYFNGSLACTSGPFNVSDQILKDNITSVSNALSVIDQLSPKTFTFKTQDYPSMHLQEGTHYGLIAEDVEQVLPDLVLPFAEPEVKDDQGNTVYDQVDFKAVNYTELISVLIAGMKEQQTQINDLQTQLNGCCSPRLTNPNTGSIELENMEGLQLQQNDPNPFSESTQIKWNVPDEFQNAMIYFYDNSGNQVNSYKVNSKGAGELQVFGSKLSAGIYTYTLIVDGKVVDTKKMVKTQR
jgi:hypothetical protein